MNSPSRRTLTARTPEDLLAVVPLVLGFHPEQSLVMLTFSADRSSFHARVDLPAPGDEDELVDVLLSAAVGNDVDRVAFIFYTPEAARAFELAPVLVGAFAAERIRILDLIRTDGRRWFPLAGGPDHEGTAYDVSAHEFVAQGVFDGAVTHQSRLALAESLTGPADEVAQVESAIPAMLGRLPDLQQSAEARWVCDLLTAQVRDRTSVLAAADVARMVVALMDVDVRDVAWTHMTRANAAAHVEFWTGVVQRCPDDFLAAPATLLAFAAWLGGRGALAWCSLDRARAVDPDYRLAGLLATTLEGAVPPSVWHPMPVETHPLLNPA